MGATTNGFVLTSKKNKNAFQIWNRVKYAIIKEMMEESQAEREFDLWWRHEDEYSVPTCRIYDIGGMMGVEFMFKGEQRDMKLFLDCDSDYSYYKKGSKIITSLGAWGESVRLTEVVLRALSNLGSIHIVDNDCETEWRELK